MPSGLSEDGEDAYRVARQLALGVRLGRLVDPDRAASLGCLGLRHVADEEEGDHRGRCRGEQER